MKRFFQSIHSIFYRNERAGTVRYMFPALVLSTVLLSTAVLMSSDVSYIKLMPSETAIETGNRFKIDVYANVHVPVSSVDITLEFDPLIVEVVGVDRKQSVLNIWTEDPIVKDGKVILRGGTYKRGFVGEHLIASISLKGKEIGQSSFSATDIILLTDDEKGTPVAVGKADDSIVNFYIYDENTSLDNIDVNVSLKSVTDIDGDGKITLTDAGKFMTAWKNKEAFYDFNNDGKMTFRDFSILMADLFSS